MHHQGYQPATSTASASAACGPGAQPESPPPAQHHQQHHQHQQPQQQPQPQPQSRAAPPAAAAGPESLSAPVHNMHVHNIQVQNIQVQSIQVQNVLVQPTAVETAAGLVPATFPGAFSDVLHGLGQQQHMVHQQPPHQPPPAPPKGAKHDYEQCEPAVDLKPAKLTEPSEDKQLPRLEPPANTFQIVTVPQAGSATADGKAVVSALFPCCAGHKDCVEAKLARTPLAPATTHTTHSPQLPAPSPNYPTELAAVKTEPRIPNRNVPMLSSSQAGGATSHHADYASQPARTQPPHPPQLAAEVSAAAVKNELCTQQHNGLLGPADGEHADPDYDGEIVSSVRRPATFTVLNVPYVGRGRDPDTERQLVSKLDLAAARRRDRRQRRVTTSTRVSRAVVPAVPTLPVPTLAATPTATPVVTAAAAPVDESESSMCSSSDSESDEGCRPPDLWILSGPPDKPNYTPDKMKFLRMFGLTTYHETNEVELAKLERRKWNPPWTPLEPDEVHQPCLDLPVPSMHPAWLNNMPDFGAKLNFLNGLGLRTVSERGREEWEKMWMKIIEMRRKRDGDTALTTYCIRAYQKMRTRVPPKKPEYRLNGQLPRPFESMRLALECAMPAYVEVQEPRYAKTFVVHNGLKRNTEEGDCVTAKRMSVEPPPPPPERPMEAAEPPDDRFRWPGVQEVMEAYHRHTRERSVESQHLRQRCSLLADQVRRKQTEADVLERKLRELRSLHIFHEQERVQIEKTLGQLHGTVAALR